MIIWGIHNVSFNHDKRKSMTCVENGLTDLGAVSLAVTFSKILLTQTLHSLEIKVIQTFDSELGKNWKQCLYLWVIKVLSMRKGKVE